jgi:hypothetical protein
MLRDVADTGVEGRRLLGRLFEGKLCLTRGKRSCLHGHEDQAEDLSEIFHNTPFSFVNNS